MVRGGFRAHGAAGGPVPSLLSLSVAVGPWLPCRAEERQACPIDES